jgi:hypothetical protein
MAGSVPPSPQTTKVHVVGAGRQRGGPLSVQRSAFDADALSFGVANRLLERVDEELIAISSFPRILQSWGGQVEVRADLLKHPQAISLWAGQSVALARQPQPAAEIVAELVSGL